MGNWDLVSRIKTEPVGSDSTISADALSDPSSGKKTPPTQNNFQKFFGNVSDDFKPHFEWGDFKDGDDSLQDVFDNALNGHYKSVLMKHGPKSGFIRDQFKTLGESAWAIARHIKDGDRKKFERGFNPDKYSSELDKLREAFYGNWKNAQGSVYLNQEGLQRTEQDVYFTADARLQSPEAFKKANFMMEKGKGKAGSNIATDVKSGLLGQSAYALQNANGAYNSVDANDAMDKDQLRKVVNPIIQEWSVQGFASWDRGATAVDRYDNITKTMGLIDDTLNWVAEHGSPKQDKDLKNLAIRMRDDMKLLDYGSKKKYMLNNIPDWNRMTENLGFYGSQHVYNKHKDVFNDSRYYSGDTPEEKKQSFSDSKNLVAKRLQLRKEYRDTSKRVKAQAYQRLHEDMKFSVDSKGNISASTDVGDQDAMIYKFLLNENGDIRGRNDVLGDIRREFGKTGKRFNSGYRGTLTERVYVQGDGGQGTHIGATEAGGGGSYQNQSYRNPGYTWTEMINAYDRVKKGFKTSFGKVNMQNVAEYTSMNAGLGYKRSERIMYSSVDFNIDNPKTDNVNKILQMVKDKDWSTDVPIKDIFISTNDYNPAISTSYVDEKLAGNWTSAQQRKYFRSFFKDEDAVYDVEFSRESPLRGKSFYTFTKKGSDKKLSMYVDRGLAHKYQEAFVKNTFTSSSDWSFNVDGVWDMTYAQGTGNAQKAKNLQIVNNSGVKYLSGTIWDPRANEGQGDFVPKYLELGRSDMLSIRDAENIVTDYLNSITR